MKSVIVICSFLAVCASAIGHSKSKLVFRQTCPSGETECGSGCIPISYTCCPDEQGGCPSTEYCDLASNGIYGCCPNGETCAGSAPAPTTDTFFDTTTFLPTETTSALFSATTTATSGGSIQCDPNWKICGDGCIPNTWTCCPDQSGGCDPLVAQCYLGSDGRYGCCPDRYLSCTGPAGDPTTIATDFTEPTAEPTTTIVTTPRATPTTSRVILTTSARTTSATEVDSSVTAVGTRSISSHSTAAQTSTAIQVQSSAIASHNTMRDPFAALFSVLMAAAAFLIG